MSDALCDLCYQLCGDVFGAPVADVVRCLLRRGPSSLAALVRHSCVDNQNDQTQYKQQQQQPQKDGRRRQRRLVTLALQVLWCHGLVELRQPNRKQPLDSSTVQCYQYSLRPHQLVQLLLAGPRYLWALRWYTNGDDVIESLVRLLLRRGRCTTDELVRCAVDVNSGGDKLNRSAAGECVSCLLLEHYMVSCGDDSAATSDDQGSSGSDATLLKLALQQQQTASDSSCGERQLWWRANLPRLEQLRRHQLLAECAAGACGPAGSGDAAAAALVMRQLLTLGDAAARCTLTDAMLAPVGVAQLRQILASSSATAEAVRQRAVKHLEQYLRALSDSQPALVQRCGEAGGGQYCVPVAAVFSGLAWATADDAVQEQFGSRGVRVFRLVRAGRYVEQESIQRRAMLPAKEAKLLTYRLHGAAWLTACDLRRPGAGAAAAGATGRSVSFLLTVRRQDVLRQLMRRCYVALANSTRVRRHRSGGGGGSLVARLADKQRRVDALLATLRQHGADDAQLDEVRQSMSEAERRQLAVAERHARHLLAADSHVEQSLFIVGTALRYDDSNGM